jgi:DNA polymerase III alpha subunit
MNTIKIDAIEVVHGNFELVDIEVENDHMFWIGLEKLSILSHNSGAADVDSDVGDRDKVLDLLRTEFGYNNVVPISNLNVLKIKSLVKDLSKFHGIPFDEANAATRTVEDEVRKAVHKHGDDKNLFILTYDDAIKYSKSFSSFLEKYPQVGENIKTLFKEQRSLGRHAGGVVIMDDAPSQMPLITSKGEPQTSWVEGVSQKTLEPLGILKIDLLGLETLRLYEKTIELILVQKYGKLLKLELDDNTVIEAYENQSIKLTNGSWILAKDLTSDHDVDPSHDLKDPS